MNLFPRDPGTEKLSLDAAWAWIDAHAAPMPAIEVPLAEAAGLVLAADVCFPTDRPPNDMALIDGFALRAESAHGASGYNPLPLELVAPGAAVGIAAAAACIAGAPPPDGADSILPPAYVEIFGPMVQVCEPIPRGFGMARRGESAKAEDLALAKGRRLGPAQLALLASCGLDMARCVRRPVIGLSIAGAKPPAVEALTAALGAATARDGGEIRSFELQAPVPDGLDAVVIAGRSGWGGDDDAAARLEQAGGVLVHHGVALTPGGSAGLGLLKSAPALMLPGDPFAALANYEILAGRLVRRMAGRRSLVSGPTVRRRLARKIASQVGVAEFIPLLMRGDGVLPLTPSPADGLPVLAKANGYVLVPAGKEGFAEGAEIDITLLSDGEWE